MLKCIKNKLKEDLEDLETGSFYSIQDPTADPI